MSQIFSCHPLAGQRHFVAHGKQGIERKLNGKIAKQPQLSWWIDFLCKKGVSGSNEFVDECLYKSFLQYLTLLAKYYCQKLISYRRNIGIAIRAPMVLFGLWEKGLSFLNLRLL